MNRVVLKHVVIFALVACAAATVLLLMPSGRNVWVARFSYYISPGEGGIPFLRGNREWAERFGSVAFSRNVVAQCRANAACNLNEVILTGIVTGATIRVSRERDAVDCEFSVTADSRHVAEDVARAYLAAMRMAVDEGNRKLVKKATSEISAALSKHEALARAAHEKYLEAQRAGNSSLEEFRVAAEELAFTCSRLRSELAECERAVSMRNDCLVVVKQLSVDAEKVDLQAGSDKSNIR